MTVSTYTVRASSWGSLFDCAYRWEGEHLLKMRKPAGLRALLGTSVHAGTAAFDQARIDGADVSVDDAAGVLINTLHHPEYEVDYKQDDINMCDAERIGLALHVRYCTELAPQFHFIEVETKLDPMEIDCGGGIRIRLTGSMDRARVASYGTGVVIPDVKTGSRVVSQGKAQMKGRSAQTGTYQLMYEQTRGIRTEGAQIIALSTGGRNEVAVSPVFDARRVMVGTDDAPGLIQHAAEMFRTGLFPPNPQSPICSPKYCSRWATCIYHED